MNETKSRAFLVFSEFGPDRRTPRSERLATCFPNLPASQIETWITDFHEIEKASYDIAVEHRRNNSTPEDSIRLIMKLYPDLNNEAADKAFNQAMYFA
jgi:hypothetical protein